MYLFLKNKGQTCNKGLMVNIVNSIWTRLRAKCEFILLSGKNKGSQCKNCSLPNEQYCKRHLNMKMK